MSCPGIPATLHCPGCQEAGGAAAVVLAVAGGIGGLGAVFAWIAANLLLIAVCAVVSAVAVVTQVVRVVRRELHEHTWHPRDAQVPARLNGSATPALAPPARPVLTAEQITGLAELGQVIHDVRAHAARQRVIERR